MRPLPRAALLAVGASRSRVGLAVGVLLALLLLAPLLGPGHVLVRDMVFVPHPPLGRQLLGLDGVPRGVPSDLVVALASRVLPTGWFQDLVLGALIVGAAWGAARLAPTANPAAAAAAATAYGWSAYLHERLLLGQWALLIGWAVLPWAVGSALAWRRGSGGWPVIAALAVAALGGGSALLLVGLAVVVCGKPAQAMAAVVVFALPWAVPGLLQDVAAGDPAGVAAFAARGDSPLGVLGSLLTGGGVWAREAVPPGRSAGAVVALLVVVGALVGLPLLRARLGLRLPIVAGLSLVLALLGRLPLAAAALRWAVVHLPAAGLLRDGQKWIAPLVLLVSAGFACGVERLLEQAPSRLTAGLLVLAPLAALPGGAWGETNRLTTSTYPAAWTSVTRQAHGPVLVLPWSAYRAFPWTDERVVLDPAVKLLRRPVVNDDLPTGRITVKGEDKLAARLGPDVSSGRPLLVALQDAGVRQVLVEPTTAGYDPLLVARQVEGLRLVRSTSELVLYDVPNPGRSRDDRPPLWPVLLGDVAAAALGATAGIRARTARREPVAGAPDGLVT